MRKITSSAVHKIPACIIEEEVNAGIYSTTQKTIICPKKTASKALQDLRSFLRYLYEIRKFYRLLKVTTNTTKNALNENNDKYKFRMNSNKNRNCKNKNADNAPKQVTKIEHIRRHRKHYKVNTKKPVSINLKE